MGKTSNSGVLSNAVICFIAIISPFFLWICSKIVKLIRWVQSRYPLRAAGEGDDFLSATTKLPPIREQRGVLHAKNFSMCNNDIMPTSDDENDCCNGTTQALKNTSVNNIVAYKQEEGIAIKLGYTELEDAVVENLIRDGTAATHMLFDEAGAKTEPRNLDETDENSVETLNGMEGRSFRSNSYTSDEEYGENVLYI